MDNPIFVSTQQEPVEMNAYCCCIICQKKSMFLVQNPKIKTTRFVVLILTSLKVLKPGVEYYSLTKDILPFVKDHMPLFTNLKIFKTGKWRKSILDALNHSLEVESGREVCKNRGFYKLKSEIKKSTGSTEFFISKQHLYDQLDLLSNQIICSVKLLSKWNKLLNTSFPQQLALSEDLLIAHNSLCSSIQSLNDVKNSFCK
ncbi:hypothetical protein EDI_076570 [Entamoeba dispar SAW760]|uniref:Uncharacterized protein n=1 Tax=Entamoeba dispar (strain ATCC PRA-260 / SAW760) TaxID=370354 RepID=B0ET27_ENTDS|nr:uncharacterized protein EDI_076570 [Entamoeba dispar SAW760]EDR22319.1 hypothetical protein EDI_076570 [Entamoeba dispar SAW760]|eukprot:EDR22319.1 hypothetical protein EDI_076570 [Entamoeba dispar SAW760]